MILGFPFLEWPTSRHGACGSLESRWPLERIKWRGKVKAFPRDFFPRSQRASLNLFRLAMMTRVVQRLSSSSRRICYNHSYPLWRINVDISAWCLAHGACAGPEGANGPFLWASVPPQCRHWEALPRVLGQALSLPSPSTLCMLPDSSWGAEYLYAGPQQAHSELGRRKGGRIFQKVPLPAIHPFFLSIFVHLEAPL